MRPLRANAASVCEQMILPRILAVLCFLALPARADEAFIVNQVSQDVSVVDLEAGKAVATIAIGGKPAGVAMSPDGARAYVTSPDGGFLSVIDTAGRRVIKKIPIADGPLGIAVHPSGNPVYVAGWYAARLDAVDPETGKIIATAEVGQSPSGVAVTPDGALILTADRDSDQVSIIEAASMKSLATVKTGARPFGVTIDVSGERAYTANVGSSDVTVIDIKARRAIGAVSVGERPYAVALAGERGFVTDQYDATVTVFNVRTFAREAQIPTGDYPEGIEASPDGRHVYAVCWESNVVNVIDAASLKVTAEINVGDGPRAFGRFIRRTR